MKLHMVKIIWLGIGLAVGGAIMFAASFFITEKNTDHSAATQKIAGHLSAQTANGKVDSPNSTDARKPATTMPNNNTMPASTVHDQGMTEAVAQPPDDDHVPGKNIVESFTSGGARDQSMPTGLSENTAEVSHPTLISSGSSPRNLEIAVTVPPGEQAPAVFYDDEPRTEPQVRILDEIARDFKEAIQREVPGYTGEEVWSEARDWADERYMLFFGEEAWNKLHLQAALDAVREKEATGQLPQRSYE